MADPPKSNIDDRQKHVVGKRLVRRVKEFWWAGFCAGWATAIGSVCLRQDFYGLEDYITVVRAGWVSPWITTPLTLFLLLIIFSGSVWLFVVIDRWLPGGEYYDEEDRSS
jgi:hypothetical protein